MENSNTKQGWAALADPLQHIPTSIETFSEGPILSAPMEKNSTILAREDYPHSECPLENWKWYQRMIGRFSRLSFIVAAVVLPVSFILPDPNIFDWSRGVSIALIDDATAHELKLAEKVCSGCGVAKNLKDFPSKGEGRTERKCKSCFNEARKSLRYSKNGRKEGKQLSCRVTISDGAVMTWCPTLVQILMVGIPASQENQQVGDLIRGGRNKILDLLLLGKVGV